MNKENYTDEEFLEEVEQATKIPMDQYYGWFVKELARRYLEERKQRADNPGVFDKAPEWAIGSCVRFISDIDSFGNKKTCDDVYYRRTLPKTKAREIAEKCVAKWDRCDPDYHGMSRADTIEQAILEYEKQTKGE